METDKIKREKVTKIYNETEKLKKEQLSFKDKSFKAMKDVYIEQMDIYKFIAEQELKNIDVILDILKVTTSLSISLFIASLTTPYFNEKIGIIILLNFILIILLVMFINARNKILSKSKTILLEVFKESTDITHFDINLGNNDIEERIKKLKNLIKDLQK